ncbi:cell division protein PerM [Microbacterium halophytorum]|uniref:cell division protein PerM n=1 Tax=Microbacterium halophytorum TaxID=2067568 RepID=UPI001319FD42|nr:DUF6350 family protein [Microbacterium halophytorum]
MNRLLVAVLAAVDAVVAAVVGLGAVLAPLVLLWFTAFSGAPWGALWPTTARVWELGNLVPLHLELGDGLVAAAGIAPDAAGFVVSLAPLAFAGFVLLFAARSGRRAARAGEWVTGVASGTLVTAAIALVVLLTSGTPVAVVNAWQAALFPPLIYLLGALAGAVAAAWGDGDGGIVDRVHDRVDDLPTLWRATPPIAVRAAGIGVVGLLGVGALALFAAVVTGGGEMITLFEAVQVDAVGATGLTLANLAYLPTFLVWALAWVAGPGFAVGSGTVVAPTGADLGVVPSLPVFGLIPEAGSSWLLLVALLPVGVGALAGLAARIRLLQEWRAEGIDDEGPEPWLPRLALAAGIAILVAAAAALLAAMASGSIGPGRLVDVGPHAGMVFVVVAAEVLVGAAAILLAPRRREQAWTELGD